MFERVAAFIRGESTSNPSAAARAAPDVVVEERAPSLRELEPADGQPGRAHRGRHVGRVLVAGGVVVPGLIR